MQIVKYNKKTFFLLIDRWQKTLGMNNPTPWGARNGHRVVSIGRYAYIIGGSLGSTLQRNWLKYDIVGAPLYEGMPYAEKYSAPWIPRERHSVVKWKSGILMSGGYAGGLTGYLNDVWYLNALTDEWELKTNSAPWKPRFQHSMVVHRRKIYLCGGNNQKDVWSSLDGGNKYMNNMTASKR